MSIDWDDEGGFSCGGVVTASKKLKKGDASLEKHLPPRNPKSLLFIPPSRRPKKTLRLRPEKWKAAFDDEGRLVVGFDKLLKHIRKGGVDHSIRAEVWEFLLGCYELGTTVAHRERIRQARRERYNELLEQCRSMHSSIGSGSLAYTVGSKLMDVRVLPNDNAREGDAPIVETSHVGDFNAEAKGQTAMDTQHQILDERRSSGMASNIESRNIQRKGPDSNSVPSCPIFEIENLNSIIRDSSKDHSKESDHSIEEDIDSMPGNSTGEVCNVENTRVFVSSPPVERLSVNTVANDMGDPTLREMYVAGQKEKERIFVVEEEEGNSYCVNSVDLDSVSGPRLSGAAQRVTDWLWTLHRIVVDVVRTDKHLEFYNEGKNSARMSDILAVYAWVDPATGYCQGMSDLLSPFIVLFDVDADAFWCFESLFRRLRDNFQMEGPIRAMKQLEAMSKILELTDADLLNHLVLVGADNFLFAFRMLLVLFRRELLFPEALYMWEMMWAADFHQATAWTFQYQCLEALRLPNFHSPARFFPPVDEACRSLSPEPSTPPTTPERVNTSGSPSYDSLRWRTAAKRRSFCGLGPGRLWQMNRNRLNPINVGLPGPDGDQDISVFCVAAIMEQNRTMIFEKLQSMDDAIKIFNNMEVEIKVHNCVNHAVKLRQRYRNQSSKRVKLERRSISRQPRSL